MIPIYTNGDLSFNIFPCSPKMLCNPKFYCQAQFKFSCRSVQFELRLSLKPGYYHPHPPPPTHPPGKVEMQLEIDHIYGQ